MGLTQSTPEQPLQPAPDELVNSVATASEPSRPISPPHPSRSSLNPTSSRRSAFSYFLPLSHPDIQHSHLSPTLDDIRRTADIVSAKLPPELVVRVLDEAGYWAGCRSLIQKELTVMARSPSPRIFPPPRKWSNGQEGEVSIVDGREGEVWYLASEVIGCDEARSVNLRHTQISSKPSARQVAPSEMARDNVYEDKDKNERLLSAGDRNGEDDEKLKCWLRGIVIETLSKDQGWSDNRQAYGTCRLSAVLWNFLTCVLMVSGTYEHSYSWFEVSLLRDGKEVENSRRSFQNNVHGQSASLCLYHFGMRLD